MENKTAARHKVVDGEQWRAARPELLETETAFTKMREEMTRQQLDLPWQRVATARRRQRVEDSA